MSTSVRSSLLASAGLFVCVATAAAQPSGVVSLANAPAGGLAISATSIQFLPAGGPFGTGMPTNIMFAGGFVGPGELGMLRDVTAGGGPVINFMTFVTAPALEFDLTAFLPGSAMICSAATPLLTPCSPAAGSPFVLMDRGTFTDVSFGLFLTAKELVTGRTSPWSGGFTTQVTGQTPGAIQSALMSGGAIRSTYSAMFASNAATIVTPEPGTLMLLATGLAGVLGGAARSRRLNAARRPRRASGIREPVSRSSSDSSNSPD
jgi:hypothetical protein